MCCGHVEGGNSVKKLFVILGLIIAGVTVTAQSRGVGVVQGKAVDEAGAPVAGVSVTATIDGGNALKGTSDEKGEWRIVGMSRGQWDVLFDKSGFAPSKAKVILDSEQTRLWPITIHMKPAPAR
jgi:hypothetical protein